MSFAWLPPQCYDDDLTEMFLREKQWSWWTDWSLNTTVKLEEVRRGEREDLYISLEYHLVHCVYM
jgi:hypothetical protein